MIDFLKGTITPKDWASIAGILGLVAALSSAYFFMIHNKQVEEIDAITKQNKAVMENLQKAINISNKIVEYEKETEEIENLVLAFESRLPSKSEIRKLFKTVEDMAREEDVAIEIKPLQPSKDEHKETIPYQIVARGNFHKVASFINRLERYERFLKVSNLKMEPYDEGVSTFKFKMNTYRFLKPTETGEGS